MQGISVYRCRNVFDKAGLSRCPGAFPGHGDQGRLGDRGAETQGKGEHQQPDEAALAGELFSQGFTERKQADVQTDHKKGQPDNYQTQSAQGGRQPKAMPIDLSNLAIVDGNGKASRVGFRMDGDKKVRFFKTTGEAI